MLLNGCSSIWEWVLVNFGIVTLDAEQVQLLSHIDVITNGDVDEKIIGKNIVRPDYMWPGFSDE